MGLSSRIVRCAATLACAAALGGVGGGRAAVATHPIVAPHPMMRLPVVTHGPVFGRGSQVGLRGAQRGGRYGLGFAGFGLAAVDPGFGAPPPGGASPYRPQPFALLPRPPRCPLIIEVGRGLANQAATRVVTGRPFCAR